MTFRRAKNNLVFYYQKLNFYTLLKIISLTFLKVVGFFILAKYSLKYIGDFGFVGFSQIQQLIVIIVPLTTVFLQLVISKSVSKTLYFCQKKIVKFSFYGGILTSLLLFSLVSTNDLYFEYIIPVEIISTYGDFKLVLAVFFMFVFSATSIFGIYSAFLIGKGDSSGLLRTDLIVNCLVIFGAIMFISFRSSLLFTITPALVLLVLTPYFIFEVRKFYKDASVIENKNNAIHGYMISSFFSSLSAPVALFIFRSLLSKDGSLDEATEFIIIQKLIGAILIPTMLYLNNIIQPKYFNLENVRFKTELISDSKRVLIFGFLSIVILIPFLGFIKKYLLDDNVDISLYLYCLIAFAEILRNVTILLSYYCNVQGFWKVYISGEFLFILLYSVALTVFPHNNLVFGWIYLSTVFLTLSYYFIRVRKRLIKQSNVF